MSKERNLKQEKPEKQRTPTMREVQDFLASYIDVEPPDDYQMKGNTLVFNQHIAGTKNDRDLIARILQEEFPNCASVSAVDVKHHFVVSLK